MGTMKTLHYAGTVKRPHSVVVLVSFLCLFAALCLPAHHYIPASIGIAACVLSFRTVGANCSKVVSYLERMNILFLLIILIKVALP